LCPSRQLRDGAYLFSGGRAAFACATRTWAPPMRAPSFAA
jgi:hypothetical protein